MKIRFLLYRHRGCYESPPADKRCAFRYAEWVWLTCGADAAGRMQVYVEMPIGK